jgi:hypothetical protein
MRHAAPFLSALLILAIASCGDDPGGPSGEPQWMEKTVEGFTIAWLANDSTLSVELTAGTAGWVAVGFDPGFIMQDANIVIGYVADGTATVRDDWGTGPTSHEDDTVLGGTYDVSEPGGQESGGSTTITFTIPLDSGDGYDRVIERGSTVPVILARGSQDDFDVQHDFAATTTIDIQ